MGIGGRGHEGCKLDPYYHTRGSIPFFQEKHIFYLKFNKYKKPFYRRSSAILAPPRYNGARTSPERFATTRLEQKHAHTFGK